MRLLRGRPRPNDPRLDSSTVAARAGVTERAFRAIFDSCEECVTAAVEEGLKRLSGAVDEAARRKRSWLDRARAGLVAFLGFLADEPAWGSVLMLETSIADPVWSLRRDQRVIGVLTSLLDEGAPRLGDAVSQAGANGGTSQMGDGASPGASGAARVSPPDPTLTAELVIGGVVSVIRARMAGNSAGTSGSERTALVELAPALMSFIVRPYLGQAAAVSELTGRPAPVAEAPTLAAQIPVRATRRTMLALSAILQAPRASNREVAHAAGVGDEGQISKLLRRLEQRGLIENVGVGAARGEPNAWVITPYGEGIIRRIVSYYAADGAIVADPAGRARRP